VTPQPIYAPFKDKTVRCTLGSGRACPRVSCAAPKRTIPRWRVVIGCYSGIRAMDPSRCASEDAGPLRGGGRRYPILGVEENELRLISVGKPQPIEAAFENKTVRGALDSGCACPGVSCATLKRTIPQWQVVIAITMVSKPWTQPGVSARTLGL